MGVRLCRHRGKERKRKKNSLCPDETASDSLCQQRWCKSSEISTPICKGACSFCTLTLPLSKHITTGKSRAFSCSCKQMWVTVKQLLFEAALAHLERLSWSPADATATLSHPSSSCSTSLAQTEPGELWGLGKVGRDVPGTALAALGLIEIVQLSAESWGRRALNTPRCVLEPRAPGDPTMGGTLSGSKGGGKFTQPAPDGLHSRHRNHPSARKITWQWQKARQGTEGSTRCWWFSQRGFVFAGELPVLVTRWQHEQRGKEI